MGDEGEAGPAIDPTATMVRDFRQILTWPIQIGRASCRERV